MAVDDTLHGDNGVRRAMHSIEAGGHHLVIQSRRKLAELWDEIEKGDFREAHGTTQQLTALLSPLAHAQTYLGIADGSKLVMARDLSIGDVLAEVGPVTEHEVTECSAERCRGHVKLKVGEHELEFAGDVELYVTHDEGADES